MPDLAKFEQYMALVDKLVRIADKEDLAECARILAMNLAHYQIRYGELPLRDGLVASDLEGLNDQQDMLVVQAMEALVGVLGSVIQGLDKKSEH